MAYMQPGFAVALAPMAYMQPGFPFLDPPPPPWRLPPSPPSNDTSSPSGAIVAIIVIAVVASPLVLIIVCNLCYSNSSAAAAARPRPPPRPRDDEIQIHSRASDARPPRASPTAGLPAFTYSRSVKHNVTGGGEEAAVTCSVCLAAFQLGETVRLLPVCLHLYHVECIDPWLDAQSTCPLCRSDTDPTMGVGRLPPV